MPTGVSGTLNLYILGPELGASSGSIDLFTQGNSSGTLYSYDSLPLYLTGEKFYSQLNLHTIGSGGSGTVDNSLNLWLYGRGEPVYGSLDLIIFGSNTTWPLSLTHLTEEQLDALTEEELAALPLDADAFFGYNVQQSLDLFIEGDGILDGSIPTSGYINMYLYNSGISQDLDLFIHGHDSCSGNLPLYLQGVTGTATSGIDMYTFGTNFATNNFRLFTRGLI